jgi:purine-binding chemotaxis protein CheW
MSGPAQFVTLGLGAEVFAVSVDYVREILDYARPFAIPEGPDYLLGLTDVRGRATPTLDLRRKLGMTPLAPTPSTRILVLDIPLDGSTLSVGLAADRVIEVAAYTAEDIEAPPEIGVPWRNEYIRGVVRRDGAFVVVFDLVRLLTSEDVAALPVAMQAA